MSKPSPVTDLQYRLAGNQVFVFWKNTASAAVISVGQPGSAFFVPLNAHAVDQQSITPSAPFFSVRVVARQGTELSDPEELFVDATSIFVAAPAPSQPPANPAPHNATATPAATPPSTWMSSLWHHGPGKMIVAALAVLFCVWIIGKFGETKLWAQASGMFDKAEKDEPKPNVGSSSVTPTPVPPTAQPQAPANVQQSPVSPAPNGTATTGSATPPTPCATNAQPTQPCCPTVCSSQQVMVVMTPTKPVQNKTERRTTTIRVVDKQQPSSNNPEVVQLRKDVDSLREDMNKGFADVATVLGELREDIGEIKAGRDLPRQAAAQMVQKPQTRPRH